MVEQTPQERKELEEKLSKVDDSLLQAIDTLAAVKQ